MKISSIILTLAQAQEILVCTEKRTQPFEWTICSCKNEKTGQTVEGTQKLIINDAPKPICKTEEISTTTTTTTTKNMETVSTATTVKPTVTTLDDHGFNAEQLKVPVKDRDSFFANISINLKLELQRYREGFSKIL